MKVFVAGASGALGVQLVPELVAAGHQVVAMTRTASKQDGLRALGARPVVADALDPDAVARVVGEAEPEVIVHQLTALSEPTSAGDMRHPERSFAVTMTNRLRTESTDHLLAAGRAVGARRFVAQSFAAFRFARTGGPVQTEADPQTTVPDRRGRRWRLVAHPHRRRRGGDRRRGRSRPAGDLQHCRRRPRARAGVAAGAGERAGCQATQACPTLARAAGGR